MSTNDQVLGTVGGEEATADGNVDGGGAPAATGTQAIGDAARASSQSEDSGAVDTGAAGSVLAPAPAPVPAPADRSIPPVNGANLLFIMPVEVLHLIIMDSDLIARYSARLSCKALRPIGDVPPPMSQRQYIQFQKQLEDHSPRKLKHLYCPSCDTFKKPTSSRTTFTDAQAVQNHSGRRICIECGIANGHYDRRDVVIKQKKYFFCGGCKLLLTHEKEEKVVVDAVFTKSYPYRDSGYGQGAEITIDSGRKRWCKPCRIVIANLGDSGAVKVSQVYIPGDT